MFRTDTELVKGYLLGEINDLILDLKCSICVSLLTLLFWGITESTKYEFVTRFTIKEGYIGKGRYIIF